MIAQIHMKSIWCKNLTKIFTKDLNKICMMIYTVLELKLSKKWQLNLTLICRKWKPYGKYGFVDQLPFRRENFGNDNDYWRMMHFKNTWAAFADIALIYINVILYL